MVARMSEQAGVGCSGPRHPGIADQAGVMGDGAL